MFCDITTLENFYASNLGATAASYIQQKLPTLDDDIPGLSIGYPLPFLEQKPNQFVVMPAQQGTTANLFPTVLAYEDHLPFQDASFRHILLAHVLESTEYLPQLLQECWRVLDAHGQLTVILPSRRGFWARSENTPFGHGRTFSARQGEAILSGHRFKVQSYTRALYFLPNNGLFGVGGAKVIEKIGFQLFTRMGGVIIMQARKEIYSRIQPNKRILPRIEMPVLKSNKGGFVNAKNKMK